MVNDAHTDESVLSSAHGPESVAPPPPGEVNEVHFSFLDGAPETPNSLLRGSPPLVSRAARREGGHGLTVGPLQHLTGAGAPNSAPNILRMVSFLLVLGIIPSLIVFLIDISVHKLQDGRDALVKVSHPHGPLGFLIYLATGTVLCLVATLSCHIWSKEAEGSGIPQMKAIMSGFYDKMKPALSLWALLAKGVGLVCAIGGGLPVGWEGPNVHISCIVAHHLSRLPMFRSMRRDRALRMQIMACACAVGLASSFGTPIGGVLYALETTSSFYLVATFWKCLCATLAGSLVSELLYKTPLVEAFDNTNFQNSDFTAVQILAFIVMGALLGVLGAFFVRCVHYVYLLRKRQLPGTNRYILLGVMGTVAALVQYPLVLFRLDPRTAINEFFSAENMSKLSPLDTLLMVLIKFPLVVVSIGLPIPAGVFIPCFVLGSGLGRLYGELLRIIFGSAIVPGGYAVVGAAAFTAGVTRALSVSVVIFEVTGQLKHMMPMLAAVVVSVVVGNTLNRSLYDTLIIMKELPYMPHMRRDRSPTQRVYQIMRTDVISLDQHSSPEEVQYALDANPKFESFPITSEEGHLLGSIRRKNLVAYINEWHSRHSVSEINSMEIGSDTSDASQTANPLPSSGEASSFLVSRNAEQGSATSVKDTTTSESASEDMKPQSNTAEPAVVNIEPKMAVDSPDSTGREYSDGEDTFEDTPLVNESHLNVKEKVSVPLSGEPETTGGRNSRTRKRKDVFLVPDLSPLVVTNNTTLSQLHFMFVMLMPSHAYVISKGKLEGIVTRADIVQSGALGGQSRLEMPSRIN